MSSPDECSECRYLRNRIAELEKNAWQRNTIKQIIVEEGDQHGGWERVARIQSIQSYVDGLVITVI